MRVREAAAALALLATLWSPVAAQRTRDRPTLVFTVSAAYLDGTGLWTVGDQVLDIGGPLPPDHFFLNRSIKRTSAASFAATYYNGTAPRTHRRGLPARPGVRRQLPGPGHRQLHATTSSGATPSKQRSVRRRPWRSSVGAIYRMARDEFISPFVRASVGRADQQSEPAARCRPDRTAASILTIYDDDNRGTRLRPALLPRRRARPSPPATAYQLRWEIRDNIVGIQQVTGPAAHRRRAAARHRRTSTSSA